MLYERRDTKRRHLIYHLDVYFNGSDGVGGHLADISDGGLLVITDDPLPVGEPLRLALRMPDGWRGPDSLNLGAECRWSKPDFNPDYQANGLSITDAPDDYQTTLRSLLRDYGFRN